MGREVQPNRLFRAARERLPSPTGAPGPMSRQELADAVNDYVYREHRVDEKLNQDDIGRIERGRTRWPGKWRRVGLRAVLGAASDAEIGLYFYRQTPRQRHDHRAAARPPAVAASDAADQLRALPLVGDRVPARPTMILDDGEVNATNRRQVLTGALGMSATLVLGLPDDGLPDHPGELLTAVVGAYRRFERTQPSRLLIGPVAGCVELAGHIIRTSEPDGKMYAVMSEATGLAAWLCIDIQDTARARRYYRIAVEAAERSGHPLLPLYMQASLGQFAAETGETGHGLNLVRGARHRLPRHAPPLAHLWLDAVEARVLAERRDAEALTLLRDASQRLAMVASEEPVWPWVFQFDQPKLAAYQAVAATRLGRTDDAQSAFAETANTSGPKQHAVLQAEHADTLWAAGQAEAACSLAVAALETADAFESERVRQKVRMLRRRMGDRAGQATAELDERLAAAYQIQT